MLIQTVNYDAHVLVNLRETLAQIRDPSGGAPNPLVIDKLISVPSLNYEGLTEGEYGALTEAQWSTMNDAPPTTYRVEFFIDKDFINPLFQADSTNDANQFRTDGTRVYFLPTDAQLNDDSNISDAMCQPVYYVLVTPSTGEPKRLTYLNSQNLEFEVVTVASKPKGGAFPEVQNSNAAVIVPTEQRTLIKANNDEREYLVQCFEVYIQLLIYDWSKLSEEERIKVGMRSGNLIRNALNADRSRGGNCTFYDKDLCGTNVSQIKIIPSQDALRGVVQVKCVSLIDPTSY